MNKSRSIVLSKIFIISFAILGIIVNIFLFKRLRFVLSIPRSLDITKYDFSHLKTLFFATLFPLDILAYSSLYCLYRLLRNISNKEVFINENIKYLRLLSWFCFMVSFVCLLATSYYLPFILVTLGSSFLALILRIIKNVFAEAIEIKNENDVTI